MDTIFAEGHALFPAGRCWVGLEPRRRAALAKPRSWEVSDAFWDVAEPLLPQKDAGHEKDLPKEAGSRAKADISPESVLGNSVCASDRVPVEGLAQGAVREFELRPRVLSEVATGGILTGALDLRFSGVRRDGRDRMGVAKHRLCHDQGPDGERVRRAQPHGPGEKWEPSVTYWSTGVASRCPSS